MTDELARRRALTRDGARPDAVRARHDKGGRTARENIADLVDGSALVELRRRRGRPAHSARLLVAGAQLDVPPIGIVLRRGYGLGAQAMLRGSTREPLLTVAWPSAHLGPTGLEGAVRTIG